MIWYAGAAELTQPNNISSCCSYRCCSFLCCELYSTTTTSPAFQQATHPQRFESHAAETADCLLLGNHTAAARQQPEQAGTSCQAVLPGHCRWTPCPCCWPCARHALEVERRGHCWQQASHQQHTCGMQSKAAEHKQAPAAVLTLAPARATVRAAGAVFMLKVRHSTLYGLTACSLVRHGYCGASRLAATPSRPQ